MIRIYFDNKDFVDIQTTLQEYLKCLNEIKDTKYNWFYFNRKVIVNYDKIVYVEEMGDKNNE